MGYTRNQGIVAVDAWQQTWTPVITPAHNGYLIFSGTFPYFYTVKALYVYCSVIPGAVGAGSHQIIGKLGDVPIFNVESADNIAVEISNSVFEGSITEVPSDDTSQCSLCTGKIMFSSDVDFRVTYYNNSGGNTAANPFTVHIIYEKRLEILK